MAASVAQLREAGTLTPGSRLRDLSITRCAVIPAVYLSYNTEATPLLEQLDGCANPQLSETDWSIIANSSPEWLRFYRCFRVESWSRGLVVTGYLHIGVERRMLYLEWHGFALPPISSAYRLVDDLPERPEMRSLWQALGDLALLPATLPQRMSDVVRGIQEGSVTRTAGWSSPEGAAQVYGSGISVRELGGGFQLNTFLQEVDCERYLKILEARVLDAVQVFLEERKIVAKGLAGAVAQINNSTVLNNCELVAGNIGGSANTGSISDSTTNPTKATE